MRSSIPLPESYTWLGFCVQHTVIYQNDLRCHLRNGFGVPLSQHIHAKHFIIGGHRLHAHTIHSCNDLKQYILGERNQCEWAHAPFHNIEPVLPKYIFNCNNFLPKFVLIIETTISISVWLPSALSLCWCVSWLHIWRVQMMRSDHYKIFRGFIPFWITIKTDHKLRAYTTIVVIVSPLLSPVLCLVFVCIYLFF